MTEVLKRIKKVVNWLIYKGIAINEREISEMLGYTKSSFSQIMNGRVPTSDKFVSKLCSLDENINSVWVLTGEGEMLFGGKADEKSDGTVMINAQAWEVIRRQSESLASRDRQIDELISLLKDQMQEIKKTSAPREGRATCADAG